jgi:uncharacterized LabA/DUF88 family protein
VLGRRNTTGRRIAEVRMYAGRPSSKDSKTYAAHMRQANAWAKEGVAVITRPLRYPHDWPSRPPVQKGIDVELAVDLIRGYVMDEFDVGIVASTDTDLLPAIESIWRFDRKRGYDPVEVCAWKAEGFAKQLRLEGQTLWCHQLARSDYERVADRNDYNVRPFGR